MIGAHSDMTDGSSGASVGPEAETIQDAGHTEDALYSPCARPCCLPTPRIRFVEMYCIVNQPALHTEGGARYYDGSSNWASPGKVQSDMFPKCL